MAHCSVHALLLQSWQRSGVIAAVGSIAASITAPYCGIYSASKAATRSMIEAMRLEMSPYNVKATFIEAGMFRSSIIQKSTFDISQYTAEKSWWSRGASGIEAIARYIEETPTTTAEQVAVAVVKQLCQKHGPPAHFLVDGIHLHFCVSRCNPQIVHI